MRDPNRLDEFYEIVYKVHKEHFPDLRFGQLMIDFLGWVWDEKGIDPYYVEDQRLQFYLVDFCHRKYGINDEQK